MTTYLTPPTTEALAGIDPAEKQEALRIYTQRGNLGRNLHRPIHESLTDAMGEPDLPLLAWREIDWFGPLELWRGEEHEVSEIMFNGPLNDPIYIIQRGAMTNTGVTLHPSWVTWMQRQLLLRSNKLDPYGDGRWPTDRVQGVADLLRYAVTQYPASTGGPSFTIRLLPHRWRTLDDLVLANTLTREAADLVLTGLDLGASVLVAGSTGSGKTTITAGFTQELGNRSRLVFVEDGGELPRTANSVHLEANSDVVGDFAAAVKFTLRQKPNYVIVGEVRGGEAMALLQAAATGHPGIGTIHASDVQSALRNLERMAMLGLSAEAGGGGQATAAMARGLITSASVSLMVIHVGRTAKGRRSVLAIEEVSQMGAQGQSGDRFPTNPLFHYDSNRDQLVRVGNVNAPWGAGRY